jgi:hypothetical protein
MNRWDSQLTDFDQLQMESGPRERATPCTERRKESKTREMAENSTPREERTLQEQLKSGTVECPRCGSLLTITPVQPRPDVAYVRDRAVLSCSECHFKAVVDRR